jgi:PmbA protein
MNLVAGSASAFSVLLGLSFLVGKLGERVSSEILNLTDNPHHEDSKIPRSFDDEGIATRKNIIIENGVLKTYLHNRFTSAAFNAELTGNAGWIMPHAWHIEVAPGDYSREELIQSIDKGFILNNVTYIRFQNYLQGDFSGIIRDGLLYVENGEIKEAVKGLRLSDNVIRILQSIRAEGKDVENIFHWWLERGLSITTPSILVEKCTYTRAHGI